MKEAVKFSVIYSAISILVLVLCQIFFTPVSVEIFSYSLGLYLLNSVIGIIIFLVFGYFITKYYLSIKVRIIFYAILCLLILNSIPLFGEQKILTFDVIKGLFSKKIELIGIGVHIIAIISFAITATLITLRK